MTEKNEKKAKMNPLLAAVKPLARQYVNEESISRVFDQVTAQCELAAGEKPVLIVSRGADGTVCGGLYGATGDHITTMFSRMPIERLLDELLK